APLQVSWRSACAGAGEDARVRRGSTNGLGTAKRVALRGVRGRERGRAERAHGDRWRRVHDDGVELGQAPDRARQEIAAGEAIEIAEGGDEVADAAVRGGRGECFAQA